MLIDCARMLPWWNRAAASAGGAKGALTSSPAEEPGLWGELDGHWNARDLEYVEGRTKCLHYTALHQQPWNPFPEQYSYHPNPLAYSGTTSSGEADADGFEVFTREAPSPGFARCPGLEPAGSGPAPDRLLSDTASGLLRQTGARSPAGHRAGRRARRRSAPPARAVTRHDFGRASGRLPEECFDAVLAVGIFERVPPADADWVMRELFAAAEPCPVLRIQVRAAAGLRQPGLVAAPARGDRHPLPGGELGAGCRAACHRLLAVEATRCGGSSRRPTPLVWALTGEGEDDDRQARRSGGHGRPLRGEAPRPTGRWRACATGCSAPRRRS